MFNLLHHAGWEVPLALILIALLTLRTRVKPKASLLIKTSSARVWELIKPYDGKVDLFGRVKMTTRLVDAANQTYEVTWAAAMPNGSSRPSVALFCVAESETERKLVLLRAGLQGRSERNELLEINYELLNEAKGTRLVTKYVWGSRSLLAQLLARADLWGGAYRMKAMAETGKPNEKAHRLISAGVAIITGIFTVLAFGLSLGMPVALVLVFALFVHEFGHLLAFRLIGQPWGRIVFLPFLGAIAVPRMNYETQAQSVFAALMGPGFSCLLLITCALAITLHAPASMLFMVIGVVTAGLNLFNLLPTEPLDGGVALRSVLTKLIGNRAPLALMALGLVLVGAGFYIEQIALVIFGGFAVLGNLKPRKIDVGLTPLTSLQVSIFVFGYVVIFFAHYTMLFQFMDQLKL